MIEARIDDAAEEPNLRATVDDTLGLETAGVPGTWSGYSACRQGA